jgi:hypothetical protein
MTRNQSTLMAFIVLFGCLTHSTVMAEQPKADAELTLYVRESSVIEGQSSAAVLEVVNRGTAPILISDRIEYRRRVPTRKGCAANQNRPIAFLMDGPDIIARCDPVPIRCT